MSTFAQTPVVLSPGGFGVNHDYSITCSAGNSLVIMTRDYVGITSVTLLGASGTLTQGYVDGSYASYGYAGLPSGVTGVRVTTSGVGNDTQAVVYEAVGSVQFDVGATMPVDFTEFVSATVTTTGTDSLLTAIWAGLGDVLTDDAGYDHSATVDAWLAQYNDTPLGAPGSETIGGTFDAQNSRGGYAVAYKSSSVASAARQAMHYKRLRA